MTPTKLPSWQHVWREGVAPCLSLAQLTALRDGLACDSKGIIQGRTTKPSVFWTQHSKVGAACVLGYCGWVGDGLETVGEVLKFFIRLCGQIDQRLNHPIDRRFFINFVDHTPRAKMIAALLPEVERSIAERSESCAPSPAS
jgi:hypothetical protein